jgi:hypothetical protein
MVEYINKWDFLFYAGGRDDQVEAPAIGGPGSEAGAACEV